MIALRSYRLGRRPHLRIEGHQLLINLPSIFGAKRPWRIPLHQVAVADLTTAETSNDWIFAESLNIPYACTTSPLTKPNLVLLFGEPQRIPPVRFVGSTSIGVTPSHSRTPAGFLADGLELRAKDPTAAVHALVTAGAQDAGSVEAYFSRRGQAWPASSRGGRAVGRRWPWVLAWVSLLLLTLLCVATAGGSSWWVGPMSLAGLTLGRRVSRRRTRRTAKGDFRRKPKAVPDQGGTGDGRRQQPRPSTTDPACSLTSVAGSNEREPWSSAPQQN